MSDGIRLYVAEERSLGSVAVDYGKTPLRGGSGQVAVEAHEGHVPMLVNGLSRCPMDAVVCPKGKALHPGTGMANHVLIRRDQVQLDPGLIESPSEPLVPARPTGVPLHTGESRTGLRVGQPMGRLSGTSFHGIEDEVRAFLFDEPLNQCRGVQV